MHTRGIGLVLLTKALGRLLRNSHGARARLAAKYTALGCDSSVAMMRRLFAAVVKPTVAYGCEIWGTLCVGNMVPELRKMADVQLAFYRQTLRLKKAVPGQPGISFWQSWMKSQGWARGGRRA